MARTRQQYYTGRDGEPMNLHDYTKKLMDKSYTIVKRTKFKSGWAIQTDWYGYDESAPSGRFLFIYSTCVIDPDGRRTVIRRYSEDDEARAGHENMLSRWKQQNRREILDERIPELEK